MNGFCQEDGAQIVFVGELVEYRCCRSSHGILEIDSITQVHCQRQPIDDEIHPLAHQLIDTRLLQMQWEQHQHDIRNVCDENGTCVEHQTSAQHFHQMTKSQALREIAVVDKQIDHARHLIDYIEQQQIE